MYSLDWFDTFAASVPAESQALELAAIERAAPPDRFPRVLDIGCGVGRVADGLARRGYRVTGIDVSDDALRAARERVPAGEFIQLDQRRIGELVGPFDLALILWHSLGFGSRADDAAMLEAVEGVLRPDGAFLLDLFHPDWLAANELVAHRDARGATVERHVRDGRCVHRIEYASGAVDAIEFNLYSPDEITALLVNVGFEVAVPMAWWRPDLLASREHARYQVACRKVAKGS